MEVSPQTRTAAGARFLRAGAPSPRPSPAMPSAASPSPPLTSERETAMVPPFLGFTVPARDWNPTIYLWFLKGSLSPKGKLQWCLDFLAFLAFTRPYPCQGLKSNIVLVTSNYNFWRGGREKGREEERRGNRWHLLSLPGVDIRHFIYSFWRGGRKEGRERERERKTGGGIGGPGKLQFPFSTARGDI